MAGVSSRRIVNFVILPEPPQFDRGEMTDKGYINQRAVLRNKADLIEALYDDYRGAGGWAV